MDTQTLIASLLARYGEASEEERKRIRRLQKELARGQHIVMQALDAFFQDDDIAKPAVLGPGQSKPNKVN